VEEELQHPQTEMLNTVEVEALERLQHLPHQVQEEALYSAQVEAAVEQA
jgi:hypothetical protein